MIFIKEEERQDYKLFQKAFKINETINQLPIIINNNQEQAQNNSNYKNQNEMRKIKFKELKPNIQNLSF